MFFNLDDKQKILNNQKFKQLEDFFFNPDNTSYIQAFEASKPSTKIDILETMASLLNDFKTAINLAYRIKTLIKSEQMTASSLKMDDLFVTLRKEICENLQCDKVLKICIRSRIKNKIKLLIQKLS